MKITHGWVSSLARKRFYFAISHCISCCVEDSAPNQVLVLREHTCRMADVMTGRRTCRLTAAGKGHNSSKRCAVLIMPPLCSGRAFQIKIVRHTIAIAVCQMVIVMTRWRRINTFNNHGCARFCHCVEDGCEPAPSGGPALGSMMPICSRDLRAPQPARQETQRAACTPRTHHGLTPLARYPALAPGTRYWVDGAWAQP